VNPPSRCQFTTCKETVLIRSYFTVDIGLPDGNVLHGIGLTEVWVCQEHEKLCREAQVTPGVTIRKSPEELVWIDNLDFLRFA
jgi:hypothetical protein